MDKKDETKVKVTTDEAFSDLRSAEKKTGMNALPGYVYEQLKEGSILYYGFWIRL